MCKVAHVNTHLRLLRTSQILSTSTLRSIAVTKHLTLIKNDRAAKSSTATAMTEALPTPPAAFLAVDGIMALLQAPYQQLVEQAAEEFWPLVLQGLRDHVLRVSQDPNDEATASFGRFALAYATAHPLLSGPPSSRLLPLLLSPSARQEPFDVTSITWLQLSDECRTIDRLSYGQRAEDIHVGVFVSLARAAAVAFRDDILRALRERGYDGSEFCVIFDESTEAFHLVHSCDRGE